MKRITSVSVTGQYQLRLVFDDGVEGDIDFTTQVGKGVFAAWRDEAVFRSVRVGAFGELSWGDEIDLCPDALYLEVTGQTPEALFPCLQKRTEAAHA